jgi:hypothetical protein
MAGRFAVIVASLSLVAVALPAAADALSVGNPPANAGSGFTLAVKGAKGTVFVYLSPVRKPAKGDVSLGTLKVKHSKLNLKISSSVKAGSYYVLVCTGRGRHLKCGSSARKTSVSHGVPSTTPGAGGSSAAAAAAAVAKAGENKSPESKGPGSEAKGPESKGSEPGGAESEATESTDSGYIDTKHGGVIRAEGPEGTKYTLAYAPGAEQETTNVTLTPITSLSRANGTFVGGVQITPASALFVRNTYLVVTPAQAPPEDEREAVSFEGSGQPIHTIPLVPQSSPIVMPVVTGGGYALLSHKLPKPASLARNAMAAFAPADAPSSGPYASSYQDAIASAIQNRNPGEEPDDPHSTLFKETVAQLNEWYAEITNNLIQPGEESDEAAENRPERTVHLGPDRRDDDRRRL